MDRKALVYRKNKKQYGGDFNPEEIEEFKAILRDKYTFTEDEMSQIIKKLNLSSQQFAGPYFDQIKDHFIHGEFRDKQHLIDWINYAHGELEERVETDPEYTTEDEFVDEFDRGDDDDDRNN